MKTLVRIARTGAEAFAAFMLAAMFVTFLLQIFSRYVMDQPFGWTLELCLVLWVWLVFWGNAFVVRERDHVTFDILYLMVPDRLRRVLALVAAGVIAIVLGWSFLPTWDWIDFLRIKRSATLQVPMRTIYSIYGLFLIAIVARYLWRFIDVWRHGAPAEPHEIHTGEQG